MFPRKELDGFLQEINQNGDEGIDINEFQNMMRKTVMVSPKFSIKLKRHAKEAN